MTRAVIVRMRRRAPDEVVEPWRARINGPQAHNVRDRLATWAGSCAEKLSGDFWPDIPPEVTDRDADVWEALLAVADLAGGDWPKTAREAAVTLVTASRQRPPSLGVLLLRDIRTAFEAVGEDKLRAEQILSELNRMEESPWRSIRKGEPLDPRGLSVRLAKYGIGSKPLRLGVDVVKGYARSQFEDAWKRYVPAEVAGSQSVTAVTAGTGLTDVTDVTQFKGATGPNLRIAGPDRCEECAFHIPTQGHRKTCTNSTERTTR
jgi:hypothetical protein